MARLNTRQWNLYKYLKERYEKNPNAYVTTKEIMLKDIAIITQNTKNHFIKISGE